MRQSDYYERKMRHREEMLPYLAAIFIACILMVFSVVVFDAVTSQEEPKKEWCRDQFGTERPMEMCDDTD